MLHTCIHKEIMMYKSHPMTRKYQTHEKHLKTQNFEKYMMVYFSYLSCGTVCRFLALNSQFKILWFLMNFTDLIIRRFPLDFMTVGILTTVNTWNAGERNDPGKDPISRPGDHGVHDCFGYWCFVCLIDIYIPDRGRHCILHFAASLGTFTHSVWDSFKL